MKASSLLNFYFISKIVSPFKHTNPFCLAGRIHFIINPRKKIRNTLKKTNIRKTFLYAP